MNILLINHYAGSPTHGMEYRPYYLGREWVDQGHRLTIVAASYSHVRNRQVSCHGPAQEELIDGIRYAWLRTPPYAGNGWTRVRNMLTFLARLYRYRAYVMGPQRPDVVIASSTYPLDIYPAAAIARACRAKLVFEVHDLWPLSPMELGGMPWWHPFILVMQRAEDYACRHADRVVSIIPYAHRHLAKRGMAMEKYAHIANGIWLPDWNAAKLELPQGHSAAIGQHQAAGRFLVGYAGAHGLANALHVLVEAADRLRQRPVTFVLAGNGPEKQAIQRMVAERGLDNVLLLPAISKAAIPAFCQSMDALYAGLQRQPLFRFGISPNKVFDYMMAAKPILCAIEAANDPVSAAGAGISIPAEQPSAVASAVQSLMEMAPHDRQAMGQRGKQYALAHHDYRVLARAFLGAISETQPADTFIAPAA